VRFPLIPKSMVRWLGAAAAIVSIVSLGVARPAATPAQEWRAKGLQTFDVVWNTINDTFFDPSFGGLDWKAVRDELRPKVEQAATENAQRDAIRAMLARLKRSHFTLISNAMSDALPGDAIVPIEIRIAGADVVVTRVVAGSTAETAGVKPGDVLLGVDGHDAASWTNHDTGVEQRVRDLETWRAAFRVLHGAANSAADVRVRHASGDEAQVKVTRTPPPGQTITLGNLPPLSVEINVREVKTPAGQPVGVMGFNIWMATVGPSIDAGVDRYRHDAGLVFDLRGNPGGLAGMISGIAGHLFDTTALLGAMHTRVTDLEFRANPRLSTADGRSVQPFTGPVAILMDELSASASECFAGGLQSLGRARIFGRRSMGQALPAQTKSLPNGDVLEYAIGDFLTSKGETLEGVGVIPDEAQPLSIAALAAGRDEALEAALRWVDAQRKARR
jgi:carboxyl-terminal processing protease